MANGAISPGGNHGLAVGAAGNVGNTVLVGLGHLGRQTTVGVPQGNGIITAAGNKVLAAGGIADSLYRAIVGGNGWPQGSTIRQRPSPLQCHRHDH